MSVDTRSTPAAAAVAKIAARLRELPGAPLVGLSAHDGVVLDIVAASAPRARLAEETQLLHLHSPARDAAADGVPVLVTDLARTSCWPDCRDELRWWGIGALQCQPLAEPGGDPVGVLTVYGHDRHAFTDTLAGALREVYPSAVDVLAACSSDRIVPVPREPRPVPGWFRDGVAALADSSLHVTNERLCGVSSERVLVADSPVTAAPEA
ncbi:GAF domain-containing protein [Nocardia aurantia]|uniref:GAF domain-containing protein n=1 Tax=Nocardia aurantia TaxID=2585199 RepID=A0A7K0DND6_9NOCA|nr:GAF domain-containing protein [Nocardia aurantia]MQY27253.1 hypothetical protein [Nocardia aurantia]